ncbi:hypothetical protein CASFOL_042146 [Castilleja foliolosa]|uniref:Uncharacterized protein n=1 Tax=Castilleja foliolosa TaxID=1961234 RepID=A0ABD3BB05_9LAMI
MVSLCSHCMHIPLQVFSSFRGVVRILVDIIFWPTDKITKVLGDQEFTTADPAIEEIIKPSCKHTIELSITEDLASSQIELNVMIVISPRMRRYSILICESSLKPYIDQRFSTLDSGIEFYRRYTANCGFYYIRPRTTRRARDGSITNKYVFCGAR